LHFLIAVIALPFHFQRKAKILPFHFPRLVVALPIPFLNSEFALPFPFQNILFAILHDAYLAWPPLPSFLWYLFGAASISLVPTNAVSL